MSTAEREQLEARLKRREVLTPEERRALIDDIKAELSSKVYQSSLLLEHAEHLGLVRGNGHHMAQEVALAATNLMEDRFIA